MKIFTISVCLFVLVNARRTGDRSRGRQLDVRRRTETDVPETVFWHHGVDTSENEAHPVPKPVDVLQPANTVEGRQFYPGQGGSSGSGLSEGNGDIPRPIPPTAAPPRPSKPPLPPGCLAARGQFASPNNCGNYLNCWDDVVVEQQCPNGLLFNERKQFCDFDYNVKCGNRPGPTPKPALASGSKRCPDLNGRYRSPTDCAVFYVCVAGSPIKFSCPPGLAYSDELGVCDYPNNIDCKGAAPPAPLPPSTESGSETLGSGGSNWVSGGSPSAYPQPQPQPQPTPQPTYPQNPSYAPQRPTYAPVKPSYPGESSNPNPAYPVDNQPSYAVGPYSAKPWSGRSKPDPWHQRQAAPQIEVDKETSHTHSDQEDEVETSTIVIPPWESVYTIPEELTQAPCTTGDVHRLNDTCSAVVVCRNRRPELLNCQTGYSYDKPSDSCKPFSIARC